MFVQAYMSPSQAGTNRIQYNCPYKNRCGCMTALAIKEFKDRWELLQTGAHDRHSHRECKGILNVKQRNSIIAAVKSSPMATGSAVHANLKNHSPGKRVASDLKSMGAVHRLVTKTRRKLMSERVDGIELDGSEGCMTELAESLSLKRFIERHNDPADPFHLDEHQTVCVGHQFKNGVRFMCVTTPHMLNNFARAENAGWPKQMHMDGAYNWCSKDFSLLAIGVNSLGAHYNPVSISIVNSETKMSISNAFGATCTGLYNMYQQVHLCDRDGCGFCTQLREQVEGADGRLFRHYLKSEDAQRRHFHIDKPSSDNLSPFFGWAHDKFDKDDKPVEVQQCHNHIGRKFLYISENISEIISEIFSEIISDKISFLCGSHRFQEEVLSSILRQGGELDLVSPSHC